MTIHPPIHPPIETLFLDAGGVLVFPNWERISETLARHGLVADPDAISRSDPPAKFALDQAHLTRSTTDAQRGGPYMTLLLDYSRVAASPARDAALEELYAYHAQHNLWEYVPEDVVPALERLSALGLRLVVVSNSNGRLQPLFERLGLMRFFHTVCDSRVEGAEKPDPRFFRLVLERAGARPETTLHVGDLYHVDVVGARASGLRAMLLDPQNLYAAHDVDRIRALDELVAQLR